ncbi:NAD(P)-dependent dehydrogenase, short-chain alcohol dehydrogenase family [Apibacter mensalis]|uniref:NAD(P)-dependent dehydrogenase, short-chain alcohol dehydrogenase family n=1 Tax=Apibacter mensalis TaxID=1586267 RepID=A0A0X3APN1_9FLAO|nr:SDR family NAD(P)-dependent oxidoreductase [Apibacter mensalis]CVK16321.1 NAD(P)-dependent dehydrogenase, short-chain alcohol dehydrogenase family [Apibacter mensalis]
MRRLENKIALITGAAAGIGRTTALLFAKEGAKLVLTDVNIEGVNKVSDEIKKSGGDAIGLSLDVSNEEQWIGVVKSAVDKYGRVDILFNNAGIYVISPITEIELKTWNKLININVTGVFLGMKHVAPLMAKQKKGSIINASSIAGIGGGPGHVLYGASKGAVRTMTKDIAMEFAADNVRVNSIHPGYIKTEMVDYASEKSHKTLEELGALYPMKRLGEIEEVAKAVLFLASDDASYITGAELVIDGGVMARA